MPGPWPTGSSHTVTPATARRYPYPFIDVAQYGYSRVAVNALVLGAAFYASASSWSRRTTTAHRRAWPRDRPAKTGFRLRREVR